jgi:hypothetical protein
MSRFRKKPVVIEAFLWTEGRRSDNHGWPSWLNEAWQKDMESVGSFYFHSTSMGTERFYIGTLEGTHEVRFGDWIIQGIKGELYPCKPDIFDATYEAVE